MYKILFGLMTQAYGTILRPLLVKAIEDPETEWDDIAIEICDRLFNYGA